jgi:hypothetical protein
MDAGGLVSDNIVLGLVKACVKKTVLLVLF